MQLTASDLRRMWATIRPDDAAKRAAAVAKFAPRVSKAGDARKRYAARVAVCRECPAADNGGCACDRKGCAERWQAANDAAECPLGKWPGERAALRLLEAGDPRYQARIAACRECDQFDSVCAHCRAAGNWVYLLASEAGKACPLGKWPQAIKNL